MLMTAQSTICISSFSLAFAFMNAADKIRPYKLSNANVSLLGEFGETSVDTSPRRSTMLPSPPTYLHAVAA